MIIVKGVYSQDTVYLNKAPDTTELKVNQELYPNISSKGLMTPSAWGSSGTFIFGFIGGTFPQAYTNLSDLVAGVGLGFGNSHKIVSVVGVFNVNNVSDFKTFSTSFTVSRYIAKGSSMSIGALNLFAGKASDAGASLFLAYSHASQKMPSKTPGYSRLSYTLGVGNGRFYDKSPKDISMNRGAHGTAVFANLSFGVVKNLNINAEWSGVNFGFGIAWRPNIPIKFPFKLPAIGIGVADLTRLSGEKPRLILSLSHSFFLSK